MLQPAVPVARNGRLILCYLVTGLGGSIASVTMHPDTISVGASGAIFGLFGILLALLALRDPRLQRQHTAVLINVGVFVLINLAYGATTPGIDNWAHIGGLVSGFVVGAVLRVIDRDVAAV